MMNKASARKIVMEAFTATNHGMAQEIIQHDIDHRDEEPGGWEEVEGDDAEAMFVLGEDATAEAIRDGFIEFLKTKTGLDMIKKWNKPYFDYVRRNGVGE